MAVLVAARQSALSPAQKNELRDLVFLYSNGGGDVTVRRALEQKIATFALSPVVPTPKAKSAPPVTATPAPVRPYGNTRPSPQFAPVTTSSTLPVSVPAAPVAMPVSPPPPPPATPAEAAVPVVAAAPQPEPVPSPVVPEIVVPAAPAPAPAPLVSASPVDAVLVRIRDIKAAVNQKVGNPVNLVDIDNVVGREYMVAMLEAMKRVAGNTPGDLGTAMDRLEAAYRAVETAIATHGTTVAATPPPVEALAAAPAPTVSDTAMPAPVLPAAPAPASVPPSPPGMPSSIPPSPPAPPVTPEPPRFAAMAAEPGVPTAPTGFRATSLAEDPVALRTPQDLPDPASLATSSVSGDPLFTKEVDTGLEQLLFEWVIFKKSGLFGTGPRGREHPLFKILAPLAIPHILAGRYEGATPEIRQSITDYMNGWRYEQGIIYEQDETFERYLRRVIHHIIDLQKRRRQA